MLAVSLWRCPAPAIPQSLGVTAWISGEWWSFPSVWVLLWLWKLDSVLPGEGGRSEIAQEGNSISAIKFPQAFASCSSLGPLQTGSAGLWLPESPCSADTLPHILPLLWQLFAWNAKGAQPPGSSRTSVQGAERKGSTGGNRIRDGWLGRSGPPIQKAIHGKETGPQQTQKILEQKGHFLGDGKGLKCFSDYNRLHPGQSGG